MTNRYDIELDYQELLLLDGKCSQDNQVKIDRIKKEMSYIHELPLFGQVIEASLHNGIFKWTYKDLRHCPVCNKYAEYAKHTRSGRYHRKGDKNYERPLCFRGIVFNEGFITFQGMGDICDECNNKYHLLQDILNYILDRDLPIQIKNNKTKYLKDKARVCYQCKSEIYESEMGESMTLFGQGTYKSTCPRCGAKSHFLGETHGVTNKFRMIPNPKWEKDDKPI